MEGIRRSVKSLTRDLTLTKFTVGICLLSATILLAVITISHVSNPSPPIDSEFGTLYLEAPGEEDALQSNETMDVEDLTIVGTLDDQKIIEEEEEEEENEEEEKRELPIVKISRQGDVQGTILKSREGRDYFAFYQIPYAASPVGELRFKLPEKPKRWRGVRDATKIGPECIQEEKYAPIKITAGSEACLNLNVYTPTLPKRLRRQPKLPVLFYVHGGQPHGNGTRYGAKYFMDEDVVLVTIEYRLGAFGSFTLGTEEYPGNIGFKDQVFALNWVQKNIKKFGGDPDNVMLFGNSGGSAAVNAHLLSPMSKDLFHRAIMESGSVFMGGLAPTDPLEASEQLVVEVGCGHLWNDTESALLTCLQNLDAKVIALTPASFLLPLGNVDNWEGLTSVRKMRKTVFTPDTPWNLLHDSDSAINKVPLIVGVNSQEFIHGDLSDYLTSPNQTRYLNEFWNDIFPPFTGITDDDNHTAAEEFRQFYFGDQEICNETRVDLFNLQSDHFVHACRTAGLLYANHTKGPVYFYWMPKEAAKSYGDRYHTLFPPPYGTAHADELQYLFPYSDYPEIPVGSEWFEFSKMMIQLWVSFAREGKPIPKTTEWPPINLQDNGMKWFQLDDELKIVEPFTDRMQLWDKYTENMYAGK